MRPYWAVIVDSFREALASRVLWVLVGGITLLLLALMPLAVSYPLTVGLRTGEIRSIKGFAQRLLASARADEGSVRRRVWDEIEEPFAADLREIAESRERRFRPGTQHSLAERLTELLMDQDAFSEVDLSDLPLREEGLALWERRDALSTEERQRLNRIAFETAYPRDIARGNDNSAQVTYFGYEVLPAFPVSEEMVVGVIKLVATGLTNFFGATIGVFVGILVTASIIPNMFDSGSINLLFSKPVNRPLLYLAKFLGGCSFVLINTTYLIGGLFVVVGWRFGVWHTKFLWAIPILLFLFAVYYTVAGLAGLIWRNTILVVAAAILFWLACFIVGQVHDWMDFIVNQPRRIVTLAQADDQLLTVNESGVIARWNADDKQWKGTFLQEPGQTFGPSVGRQNSWLGPIYHPATQRWVALDVRQGTLFTSRAESQWTRENLGGGPSGCFALLRSHQGAILAVGREGVFQVAVDHTNTTLPVTLFGKEFRVGPRGGLLENLGPPDPEVVAGAQSAAIDPVEGTLALYGEGKLQLLRPSLGPVNDDSAREATVDGPEEEASLVAADRTTYFVEATAEPFEREDLALVAVTPQHVFLAHEDGIVHQFDAQSLEPQQQWEPFPNTPPRRIVVSPDGRYVAVVFHSRNVWLWDSQEGRSLGRTLPGRGTDATAIAFVGTDRLLLAHQIDRVREYRIDEGRVVASHVPTSDLADRIFRWAVRPIYRVFPKPGELKKTTTYLMAEKGAVEVGESHASLESPRAPLHPWTPVIHSACFASLVLLVSCIYLRWQEF